MKYLVSVSFFKEAVSIAEMPIYYNRKRKHASLLFNTLSCCVADIPASFNGRTTALNAGYRSTRNQVCNTIWKSSG